MVCPKCGYKNDAKVCYCQNCGTKFFQESSVAETELLSETPKPTVTSQKSSKNKKKIVIAIVSSFVALSIIAVALTSVVVVTVCSYSCYDCGKTVLFEEHIRSEDDGDGVFVCKDCHDAWMQEEYGVTFSGEIYY